ncbi:hypothetical protein [Nocardioides acrostichi]|uniref:Uncharacterized protein n=1 Tax=Nocardioides acrostichi TaxID=2784339 RepID=A0A930V108_9ACTN|nr:hypothetical protein [Nocardioides acrostichi]MBF4161254.1 hypothetical protein [Nocardioides acrostichi]
MPKRRFVLVVGLPHAGAGPLADLAAESAASLAEAGVRVPARTADEARRAALELRRTHKSDGLERKDVEGTWALLTQRARREGAKSADAVLVVAEHLAGASASEIDLLTDALHGFEVHVVAVVADPARQIVRAWEESVRRGGALSLRRYARRVLDPGRVHEESEAFWADQDAPAVLSRWAVELGRRDRVHVVAPAPDDDPTQLAWTALARLLGVDAALVPAAEGTAVAVDAAALEDLAAVNGAVDGRADLAAHAPVLERVVEACSTQGAVPALLPHDLDEELVELGERWAKALAEAGYAVTGDTAHLVPAASPRPARAASTSTEERLVGTTEALADLVVELARAREQIAGLEKRNAKLEKKRRKLKTKLARALG